MTITSRISADVSLVNQSIKKLLRWPKKQSIYKIIWYESWNSTEYGKEVLQYDTPPRYSWKFLMLLPRLLTQCFSVENCQGRVVDAITDNIFNAIITSCSFCSQCTPSLWPFCLQKHVSPGIKSACFMWLTLGLPSHRLVHVCSCHWLVYSPLTQLYNSYMADIWLATGEN